ncbi:MAG: toxin-antitoxin system HicB family antitoxin [Microthrixaceae bacterium]
MGRPRVSDEKRIATAVRLPESIHRRLHRVATERDVSANLLVTKAVSDYLERLPSTEGSLDPQGPGPHTRADLSPQAGSTTRPAGPGFDS